MKRPTRTILIAVGAVFALVLLLLILLPMLFGGRIADRVKTEVNRSLDARVDWRSAGLGLLRDFPNLTLRLDDLTVVGVGKFEGDTVASIGQLRVILDLASAVRYAMGGTGPIVVQGIGLDRPRISLVALEDGTANWDITKKEPTAAEPEAKAGRPLAISLRRFDIDDGTITLDNRAAKLQASLLGLDQTLSGSFGGDQVDVETRAHADTVTVEFAGISYLDEVALDLSVDAAADLARKTLTLRQSGAPPERPGARPVRHGRVGGRASRSRPRLQRPQDGVQAHPVARAGGLRPRLPVGADLGLVRRQRPGQGRVRGRCLPVASP